MEPLCVRLSIHSMPWEPHVVSTRASGQQDKEKLPMGRKETRGLVTGVTGSASDESPQKDVKLGQPVRPGL